MSVADTEHEAVAGALVDDVCARYRSDKSVRRALPDGGTLNIDRQLPFLCVFRKNPKRSDAGTSQFVTSEASYLNAPGGAPVRKGLQQLVQSLATAACEQLGGFLLLEVWSGDDRQYPITHDAESGELVLPQAAFRILTRREHHPEGTVATLEYALQRIRVHRMNAAVTIDLHARNHPPAMTQLISESVAAKLNCHVVGLEIAPIFRDPDTGKLYNAVLRSLRRGVAKAMQKAFFTFSLNRTNSRPLHFYALGRKSLPQQVWSVDRQLADVSSQFKFLLQCTPINAERSRREFVDREPSVAPVFQYRPLGQDPLLLKRRLLQIPTERIEDAVLAHVLRQTQDELDRQITMLSDIGTSRFLPGSLQVFGGVDPKLRQLADELLLRLTSADKEADESVPLDAKAFARLAEQEIEYYRQQWPAFSAKAIVQDDMYSGLLATGGNLLIGRETAIPAARAEALLQHEIGTHLVTYYNGQAQSLRLLKVGLAGYDGLQEGLAVLAEYLVGGLSHGRLRTLAARVVAADQLVRGDSFIEVYTRLIENHRFESRIAYTIALRVFRGGGLTKDVVYLRGLVEILEWLAKGADLEPLLVGKIAGDHLAIVRELLLRGVLQPPPLRPRYLDDPRAAKRLERLRQGCGVLDLITG